MAYRQNIPAGDLCCKRIITIGVSFESIPGVDADALCKELRHRLHDYYTSNGIEVKQDNYYNSFEISYPGSTVEGAMLTDDLILETVNEIEEALKEALHIQQMLGLLKEGQAD